MAAKSPKWRGVLPPNCSQRGGAKVFVCSWAAGGMGMLGWVTVSEGGWVGWPELPGTPKDQHTRCMLLD